MVQADFSNIKGVLLDLWGTLAYNIPRRGRKEYDVLAKRIGHSTDEIWRQWGAFSHDALRGTIKTGEERAIKVLTALGAPLDLAKEMVDFEYENRSGDVHFYPGVPEMLLTLRQRGYRTCLISNCNYLMPSVVERLRLPEMMDDIILSCNVGLVKPEPEIYEMGAERLGLTPAECLFAGDGGDGEIDGAKAAGCGVVALVAQERGHSYRFPAKHYPYDIRLNTIAELANYLPGPQEDSNAA